MNTIGEMMAQGWVLFPLAKNSKRPPEGTYGHLSWTQDDTRDYLDELTSGEFNVGVVTGKSSGIIVIDVDPKNGGTVESVYEAAGEQFITRSHTTRSGGKHFVFAYPEGVERLGNSNRRLPKGVDVRGDGGYIVGPGSYVDENGVAGYYTVDEPIAPIAPLPTRLLALLLPIEYDVPAEHYQYPEEYWDDVKRWHRANVKEAATAEEGTRDDTVYRMLVKSFQLAHTVPATVLDRDGIVQDFAKKVPYLIKDLGGKADRAWSFAEVTPRAHPEVTLPPKPTDSPEDTTPDWIKVTEYTPDAATLEDDVLTDAANANRLVELFRDRIRYVEGLGWLVWDGKVWRPESENSASVMQLVKDAQEHLYLDLQERMKRGLSTKEAKRFIQYSLSTRGLRNAMELLQNMYAIRLSVDELDSHKHLLCVKNGIVDLRTGMLHEHRPELHMTQLIDVDYHIDAEAPRWDQFLREVMPDMPDMPKFLQRLVGYGITGETSEHCLAIHYGRGSNGKSIFLDTLKSVFGNISKVTDWSSFERKKDGAGSARPDLVRLRGARLVTVNEADARASIDEAQIKRMASGDAITARGLFQSEIEFYPNFLIQMATNAKPDITGADEGIWRRVKLVPWTRFFAPHERDHSLAQKLYDEREGILAWAVRGAVEWYSTGLQEPERVRTATQEYREATDILGGFIDSIEHGGWLVPEENKKVPSAWAYSLYKKWAETQSYSERDMLKQKAFKAALEERGYNAKRMTKGTMFLGLAANPNIPAVRTHKNEGAVPDMATGSGNAEVVNF